MLLLDSIIVSFFCTIWIVLGNIIGFKGWAIFAGCTIYFINTNKKEESAVIYSCCSAFLGSFLAIVSLHFGSNSTVLSLVFVFITTFLMCYLGKLNLFHSIPGSFMGSFSMFASNGQMIVLTSILFGVLLGYVCKKIMNLNRVGTGSESE